MTHPAEQIIMEHRNIITKDEWVKLVAQALIEQEDEGHMNIRTRYVMECIQDRKIRVTDV